MPIQSAISLLWLCLSTTLAVLVGLHFLTGYTFGTDALLLLSFILLPIAVRIFSAIASTTEMKSLAFSHENRFRYALVILAIVVCSVFFSLDKGGLALVGFAAFVLILRVDARFLFLAAGILVAFYPLTAVSSIREEYSLPLLVWAQAAILLGLVRLSLDAIASSYSSKRNYETNR